MLQEAGTQHGIRLYLCSLFLIQMVLIQTPRKQKTQNLIRGGGSILTPVVSTETDAGGVSRILPPNEAVLWVGTTVDRDARASRCGPNRIR